MEPSATAYIGTMATPKRRRIHLTETPRLAATIDRNAMPGETRAATVTRLVERADILISPDADFLAFHPNRSPITKEEVTALLDQDDAELIARSIRG